VVALKEAAAAPIETEVVEQEHLGRRERLHCAVSRGRRGHAAKRGFTLAFAFLTGGFCRISEDFIADSLLVADRGPS